jgi:4-hydroxy-4-methyl-2-oxoglutarate aldolase
MRDAMHVSVLGLGEAGALYAAACVKAGWVVTGFDPGAVPTPDGVVRRTSVAEAVDGADVVLGLTGARAAVAAAGEAVPAMQAGACFADMNSSAAALKREVAAVLAGSGAVVADVAVMGSVPQFGARTPLVVSGPGAPVATALFAGLGAPVDDIDGTDGEVGDATTRKLLRSSFAKGLGALIVESVQAGAGAGLEQWVRGQIGGLLVGGESAVTRLHDSTYKHAQRRAHEVDAAVEEVVAAGVAPVMTRAASAVHHQLAATQSVVDDAVVEAWRGLPVANIGDARERLGLTRDLAAPWRGAAIVGRARTVAVAAGDNLGIQRILGRVRPGDVVVVDGQGDTSRALIGELLAGRLLARGALGMVLDGALRDAEDLEEIGFPIWHRARSAAGPYKNGPFRHGDPVAVGGVVCLDGDLVIADGDGVTFVRPQEAPALLAAARAVQEDEAGRRRDIERQIASYRAGGAA